MPGGGPVLRERRDPQHQEERPRGQRSSDPRWTTREIADRLGVSPGFIVGEIREGRLGALVIERPGLNAIYRISDEQFDTYCRQFLWKPHASPAR